MHTNSIQSAATSAFSDRQNKVIGAFRILGRATDRQIREHLGFTDMNTVRPAITTLTQAGVLEEVDTEWDEQTERNVRVTRLKQEFSL